MRLPMRALLFMIMASLLGLFAACDYGYSNSHPPSHGMEGPPSPELMQYAEDLTLGWNARLASKSWRTEIDDVRSGGPVHIVAEATCPDRYHMVKTGSESGETYYIGMTMYQRKENAHWTKSSLPMPYRGLVSCSDKFKAEDPDPARIRLVAEELKDIDLSPPKIREIGGRKCREWTRTFANGKGTFSNSTCYDVNTHELVHSVIGNTATTYYWNVPIAIKPPL